MQYGSHVVHTRRARGSSVGEQRRPVPSIHYGAEADGRKAASRSSVSCLFHAIFDPENLNVSCVISHLHVARVFLFRVAPSRARALCAACRGEREFLFRTSSISSLVSPVSPVRSAVSPSALRGRAVESADSAQLEIPAYLWQPCLNALNARAQAYKQRPERK